MNFGKFDMVILVTMSVAIISMSFTFPALGLTQAGTDESEIPEFDIDSDRFDFAGDFPSRPGSPGTVYHDAHTDIDRTDPPITIASDEVSVPGPGSVDDWHLQTNTYTAYDGGTDTWRINVELWDGVWVQEQGALYDVGDVLILEQDLDGDSDHPVRIRYELIEFEEHTDVDDLQEGYVSATTEIDIQRDGTAEGGGTLERIPILGSAISTVGEVAATIAWGVSVIQWFFVFMFEMALNLLGMLAESMLFLISLLEWAIGTYGEIISSANSWTGVFVAIPGILLMLVLVKAVMIGISLLPTT